MPPNDTTDRALGFPVVVIGASAGGLDAISELLDDLPSELGAALVVIQHLDPTHQSSLPELLSRVCRMSVCEAKEGMRLAPNTVCVIPPNVSMTLSGGALHLVPRDETPTPRLPIDVFMRSLAQEMGVRSIGVVLSGTGNDGTSGLESIRAEGGITFAQDESANYGGMPQSAIATGCVDYVLAPAAIARELVRISAHPTVRAESPALEPLDPAQAGDPLEAVIDRLSEVSGVDFSNYKQATLRRRIQRRMVVNGVERVEDYRQLLTQDHGEVDDLCREALIHVTSFFRDSAVFDALKLSVFPTLLRDRPADRAIRIWVPGCSTGEEVYSLAMCLLEFLGPSARTTPIKIFGTDVSETVIEQARSGRYPERIAADVGRARLSRFFVEGEGGYVINKSVRDLCVFAKQDATRDPPFSNVDLISCRNVLIYLGPVLQKRILPFFHYALRDNGFLLLGTSETVGHVADLFTVADRKRRIYTRRPVPNRLGFELASTHAGSARHRGTGVPSVVPVLREIDALRESDRVLLARYAPPAVLMDDAMEIVQFRGETGAFLTPAPGTPSNNMRSMARDGLLPDLTEGLEEAKAQRAPVRKEGLRIQSEGATLGVDIEIIPIDAPISAQPFFLVLFERAAATDAERRLLRHRRDEEATPGAAQQRISQLERELASTKDYLRSSIEEREAANEELRAANEELLSGNEELQSTIEELQTADEELQATNEELLTVNEELQHRNEEATLLGNDVVNLLASVEIPIIMLDRNLSIRRFTPSAGKVLTLIASDIGRSILDFKLKLDVPDLESLLLETLSTLAMQQREVQDLEGRWHSLRVRPYRSQDDTIDGIVIALTDIDEIKRNAERLGTARDFANSIVMTVREPLVVLDHELRVKKVNAAFAETFRSVPSAIVAAGDEGQWALPELCTRLEEILEKGEAFESFVVEADFPVLGHRILRTNARPVRGSEDEKQLILLAIEDVTEQRRIEAANAELAEKLEATQRMKSLGVLAGGIAHDFNNILTAILGYADVLHTGLPADSPWLPHVSNIEHGALRAAELCKQMLDYSGRGKLHVERVELSALIRDTEPLLRASVSKKSLLHFELDDALACIVGDATQLRQIVMNLVINASEALGDAGGSIGVRTGHVQPNSKDLADALLRPDALHEDYIYIEVEDDGCGMDAETQAQIFDPFFTRKFTGRGLGLAAAIGIVHSHHGGLTLDSEPGRGSRFRILFPAVDGDVEKRTPAPPMDQSWRARGTVLVVDDEEAVRELLVRMLEPLGFRVLQAEHGMQAITLVSETTDDIDLVLLDLTMPHADGVETFHALRKLRPGLPVILMSGYDAREAVDAETVSLLSGLIRKPFLYGDIVSAVRAVFDAS